MSSELFQVIDKTRYANSYINSVHVNKGVQAATKVLAYGSDEHNVFSYDEATYYLLGPVLERYPNSFKDGGNLSNTYAVVCTLFHLGIVGTVPEDTPHQYIDRNEGLFMLKHIIDWMANVNTANLKKPMRVKRYRIPEWLIFENHDSLTLPDSLAPLLDIYRRRARGRGSLWTDTHGSLGARR